MYLRKQRHKVQEMLGKDHPPCGCESHNLQVTPFIWFPSRKDPSGWPKKVQDVCIIRGFELDQYNLVQAIWSCTLPWKMPETGLKFQTKSLKMLITNLPLSDRITNIIMCDQLPSPQVYVSDSRIWLTFHFSVNRFSIIEEK